LTRMLGLRYRLGRLPFPANKSIDKIIGEGRLVTVSPAHSFKSQATIDKSQLRTIFAHPPCRWDYVDRDWMSGFGGLFREPDPSAKGPGAEFSIGVDPETWSEAGDGVWFMVWSRAVDLAGQGAGDRSGAGEPRLDFARYIDPGRRPLERDWTKARIKNLGRMRASFVTLPGSSRDNDWAHWGDPRVNEASPDRRRQSRRPEEPDRIFTPTPPLLAYTVNGVRVYEDKLAGTRHYLARRLTPVEVAGIESSEEKLAWGLSWIKSIVDESLLSGSEDASLADLTFIEAGAGYEGPLRFGSGEVNEVDYGLQRVACRVASDGPGLLVLADAHYPGWRAFVNGDEAGILRVNHGLRGVAVPGGESEVVFVYQPASFRVGLWMAVATVVAMAWFGIFIVVRGWPGRVLLKSIATAAARGIFT